MRKNQQGVLYLGVLFFLAVMSLSLTSMGVIWSTERQRERERELLAIGKDMHAAIRSYYQGSPGTVKRYPGSLDELIRDNRFLYVRRHLRQIYVDPMTGQRQWTLIPAPEGGIMGVASTSVSKPIKQGGFTGPWAQFEGKQRYADWGFVYRPPSS